jgi:hypothetical protein
MGSWNERAAVTRWIRRAPAVARAWAHASAVAPVVRTSSTSRIRSGAVRVASKLPRIAARRSAPPRRAWGPVDRARRSKRTTGIPVRRPSPTASARAWSYPRSASRRRARGTHVMTSTGGRASHAMIAAERAPATSRHPENLRRCTARRAGPSKRNGARADATGSGGQSRQEDTGTRDGRPHRSHQGRPSATSAALQPEQNGHGPFPHPAHRRGNTTSSARASTRRP